MWIDEVVWVCVCGGSGIRVAFGSGDGYECVVQDYEGI